MLQACVVCNECGLGPEQDIAMVLGPKDRLDKQLDQSRILIRSTWFRFRKVSSDNQAVYCTECFDKIPKIVSLTITETLSWEAGAGASHTISL